MANKRQKNKTPDQQTQDERGDLGVISDAMLGNTNTTANNGTNKESTLMALSADQITALLANTRTKGGYTVKLGEFLTSGEAGVEVSESWPELAGKKDSTIAQGFENAKKNKDAAEGSDKVKVIKSEGKVYLVNLAAAEVEVAA